MGRAAPEEAPAALARQDAAARASEPAPAPLRPRGRRGRLGLEEVLRPVIEAGLALTGAERCVVEGPTGSPAGELVRGTARCVQVPVRAGGELLGTLVFTSPLTSPAPGPSAPSHPGATTRPGAGAEPFLGVPTAAVVAAIAAHATSAVEGAAAASEARRVRAGAEEGERRLRLLARTTALVAAAASSAEVTGRVAAALVAVLGCLDASVVLAPDAGAGSARAPEVPGPGSLAARVMASGAPVLEVAPRSALASGTGAPGAAGSSGGGGAAAALAVPVLDASGAARGVLCTRWASAPASRTDLQALLVVVAAQVAQGLERTRALEAEPGVPTSASPSAGALTDQALALQRGPLPRQLPVLERVSLAARHTPASGAEPGGGWYDVVLGAAGLVTLVVGDVHGRSVAAAGVMGQVRAAVRAHLTEGHDVAAALSRTNSVLLQMGVELSTTCCLLQLDQATGQVHVATAGHPVPLVVGPGLAGAPLPGPVGPPLAVDPDAQYSAGASRLPASSRVVLHTDGLLRGPVVGGERGPVVGPVVDGLTGEPDAGLTALLAVAGSGAALGVEELADLLVDRSASGPGAGSEDDAVVVVLDYLGPSAPRDEVSARLEPTLASVARSRRLVRDALAAWQVDDEVIDSAELVVSELVTNAITHTASAPELVVTRDTAAGCVRISVVDSSSRHPAPREAAPDAAGGRGMGIVGVLARDWGVSPRGAGKAVWAELSLTPG